MLKGNSVIRAKNKAYADQVIWLFLSKKGNYRKNESILEKNSFS